MNFGMMQHHNWSLIELEEMIPWEREIYIGLLMNYLKEEKERQAQENRKMKYKYMHYKNILGNAFFQQILIKYS